MKNKVSYKFLVIKCIFLAGMVYLTGLIAQYIPNIRSIRIIEATIMFIIGIIGFFIIERYEKKHKNKN
jgi:positive regulator of sigma E activity